MSTINHRPEAAADHRLRRVLGLCRTVTSHMRSPERNLEEHVHHLIGRLTAIGRGALHPAQFDGVDLELLVLEEMRQHAVEAHRLCVAGETVILAPHAAELMSLLLHELATNAVKYGALGQLTGRIRVVWRVLSEFGSPVLHFEWLEHGVAIAGGAAHTPGFGVALLERLIARELRGEGKMRFLPDGVCCAVRIPLNNG